MEETINGIRIITSPNRRTVLYCDQWGRIEELVTSGHLERVTFPNSYNHVDYYRTLQGGNYRRTNQPAN